MRIERVLYIHAGYCTIYDWSKDRFVEGPTFSEGDAGPDALNAFLIEDPDRLTAVLADIVEEEHYRDTVPKLSAIDQRALLKRRISRSYLRTPYRDGALLKDSTGDAHKVFLRLSGITRPDAIRVWTTRAKATHCPIIGIFTPALLSERILKAVKQDKLPATLIVTTNSDGRVRHSYFKGNSLIGSRRFRDRTDDNVSQAEFIVGQVGSSLRHFNPSTTPGAAGMTDVVLIGDEFAGHDEDVLNAAPGCRIRCVDIGTVAKTVGMSYVPNANQAEMLFVSQLRKRPHSGNYAPRHERRYGLLNLLRWRTKAAAWVLASTALAAGSINVYHVLNLRSEAEMAVRQTDGLEAAQWNLSDVEFPIDPLAMRAAVTSFRGLQRNSPRPEELFGVVSAGLESHPDIQIDGIKWSVATVPESKDPVSDNSFVAPTRNRMVLSIVGSVTSFSGNYEHAFSRVNAFIESLRHQHGVVNAHAVRMPLNVNPQSSVDGEISARAMEADAKFEIKVFMRQDHESA